MADYPSYTAEHNLANSKRHKHQVIRGCCFKPIGKFFLFFLFFSLVIAINNPTTGQTKDVSKTSKPKPTVEKPNALYLSLLEIMNKDKNIKAAQFDAEGKNFAARAAFSDLLPTIKLTGNTGHERQQKHKAANTSTGFNEISVKGTQLLYDFGKVNKNHQISQINFERSKLNLAQVKGRVTLGAVKTYLNLYSAYRAYKYAEASELRIKKVYGTEEFRVKRGSGLASNLLQIRRRLASARRTTLLRQTSFLAALTQYKKTFKKEKVKLKELTFPRFAFSSLPKTLAEAQEIAAENSIKIETADLNNQLAKLSVEKDEIPLYGPKVELILEGKWKNNVGGTIEGKRELIAKLEATFPLYKGGKDIANYEQSKRKKWASDLRLTEAKENLIVEVTNNWRLHVTSKANFAFAQNEANIAAEFMDIVKKERTLNKRKLLEFLNAELALYSALSAANQARGQVVISAATLMNTLAKLEVEHFK